MFIDGTSLHHETFINDPFAPFSPSPKPFPSPPT